MLSFFSPLRIPGKPILRCERREQWEIKLEGSVDCESQKGNDSLENLNSVMKWLERKREDEWKEETWLGGNVGVYIFKSCS